MKKRVVKKRKIFILGGEERVAQYCRTLFSGLQPAMLPARGPLFLYFLRLAYFLYE